MTKLHKVLLFGGREWASLAAVDREVKKLVVKYGNKHLLIYSGGAPGADTCAQVAAKRNDVHFARIDALWDTRYRGAGPQRNEIMALLEPDEAIGFHTDIKKSRGTKDMAKRLDKYNIKYKIVRR